MSKNVYFCRDVNFCGLSKKKIIAKKAKFDNPRCANIKYSKNVVEI